MLAQLEEADQHLLRAEFSDALRHYASILAHEPLHPPARLGAALSLSGLRDASARDALVSASRHALRFGAPLLGLFGISRLAQEKDARASILAREAATLYVGATSPSPAKQSTQAPLLTLPFMEIVGLAKKLVLQEQEAPPSLIPPAIPLLSQLPKVAFAAACLLLKAAERPASEIVFQQQSPSTNFYLIASGEVQLLQKYPESPQEENIGIISSGACTGESSLLSGASYPCSAKTASPARLLVLSQQTLNDLAKKIPELSGILEGFARERLLRNLLATAPIFRPFPKKRRIEIMRLFSGHDVAANTPVITEGKEGNGLYIIVSGVFEVSAGSEKNVLATLLSGDLFGEMSLLKQKPTNASVYSRSNAQLLFLSRENFWKLLENEPALRDLFQKLSDDRSKARQQMLAVEEIELDDEISVEEVE
jgi:CRP-like cAMP-binding protein